MYTKLEKLQSEHSAGCPQPQCFRLHPQINSSCIQLYLYINMSPSEPPGRLLEARDKHLQTDLEEQKLCS